MLTQKGPLLLACNHSNSFLDALIIGSFFKHPVHFLARGDAFKNPLAKKILTSLKVIPIYRLSEGKEYLALNDVTFDRCAEILLQGGIVLIFSEGLCQNEWQLRLLKKGTARIAINASKQPAIAEHFKILPVSLNYSSFKRFRKTVVIHFGDMITLHQIQAEITEGEQMVALNRLIFSRLKEGLLIEDNDKSAIQFLLSNCSFFNNEKPLVSILKTKQGLLKNRFEKHFERLTGTKRIVLKDAYLFVDLAVIAILFAPALISLIIHLPLYAPLKKYIEKKTSQTVFFHSALFGALIIVYPLYALTVSVMFYLLYSCCYYLSAFLIMPILAWLFLVWLDAFERVVNFYKMPAQVKRDLKRIL